MKKKYKRKRTKRVKICKNCGKEFNAWSSLNKYCSAECNYQDRPKKGETIKCKVCGKEFYKHPRSTAKTCSMKCMGETKKTKKQKVCVVCGKVYYAHLSQEKHRGISKYCSNKCKWEKDPSVAILDGLWSQAVKVKADYKCEFCGKETGLNSHHIFSRTNYSVRWVLNNGICLCAKHHLLGNMSAHKAPIEFVEWIKEHRGFGWYENLRKTAREVYKTTVDQKRAIKKCLEGIVNGKLKELEEYND